MVIDPRDGNGITHSPEESLLAILIISDSPSIFSVGLFSQFSRHKHSALKTNT